MKLEDQVCSLEIAKKLKDLGVKQESYFRWVCAAMGGIYLGRRDINDKDNKLETFWAAFTVAELGEMLKGSENMMKNIGGCSTEFNPVWKYWQVFLTDQNNDVSWQTDSETEADARAKMLVYLIENKLMEAPK